MLLAMSLTLASASDRPPDSAQAATSLVQLSKQAYRTCRQSGSPEQMAKANEELRFRAELLSQTVHDLTHVQLPELQGEIAALQDPGIKTGLRDATVVAIDIAIDELQMSSHGLTRSIATSELVEHRLVRPDTAHAHGVVKRQALKLCAGDQVQLTGAILATGQLMASQEPLITQISIMILQAATRQPAT